MFGRKYWAESPLSEHSAQKQWPEGSDSFRIEGFWFLWRALFPAPFFFFFLLWFGIPWFFWSFPFLALVFLLRLFRINHMDFVTANSQLFSSSFEILRTDILLSFCIRPLKSCCDQLHQVIH